MSFLKLLESMRTPILDGFFSVITYLGDEIGFLAIALLFYWCINKRSGIYVLVTGLFGTIVNQTLKLIFRIPRPWVLDPEFTIVESARDAATGYSFPSGHTQNATGTFGAVGHCYSRKRPILIICSVLIVLTAFSRMYLGVHTPLDVSVSLAVGLALVLALYPMFKTEERYDKFMPYIVFSMLALSLLFLVFVLVIPKEGLDLHNYHSGLKNACTLLGVNTGLVLMYFLDRKYIKFETRAVWYVQVIKLIVGFALVLGIKSGLSSPLTSLFGNEYVARAVRYFLITAVAGVLWPMCFKYLARIRIPAFDRFGTRVAALFKKEKAADTSDVNISEDNVSE